MESRDRLLAIMKEKSHERGQFVLTSGRKSDFYVDGKQTTLNAEGSYLVGKIFFDCIQASDVRIEGVGGLSLGADPIVTAISVISYLENHPIQAFIIRKEPKKHGKSLWVEGGKNLKEGAKVTIVDDVVTTGGSTLKAVHRAIEEGFEVVKVMALVDREEGGRENLISEGYQLEAIFTKKDFL
ncbi:MAG: orotate phosphoribosyltransferase [Thermodesulfobacteriota bacterium]|nr:orotate phosphoribosyltransferase [Thermodesulfobacteriota bacterium]